MKQEQIQSQTKDELAFSIITEKFNNEYTELYDSLYYYMEAYIKGYRMDIELFRDEVENYLNIRSHTDIVNYILKL